MIRKLSLGIALSLLVVAPSVAVVFGGSNLGLRRYPSPMCTKPIQPYSRDEYAVRSYKLQADQYIDCANEYIENANNDIKRIKEQVEDLRRDAESPY